MFSHRTWRFIFIVRKACLDLNKIQGAKKPLDATLPGEEARGDKDHHCPFNNPLIVGLISRNGPVNSHQQPLRCWLERFLLKDSYISYLLFCSPENGERLFEAKKSPSSFQKNHLNHPPPCLGFEIWIFQGVFHGKQNTVKGHPTSRPAFGSSWSTTSSVSPGTNPWRGSNGELSGEFFSTNWTAVWFVHLSETYFGCGPVTVGNEGVLGSTIDLKYLKIS